MLRQGRLIINKSNTYSQKVLSAVEKSKAGKRIRNVGKEMRDVSWLNSEGRIFPEEIEEIGARILGRFIFGH